MEGETIEVFSRADRTILTIAALALTGIFWFIGVEDFSSAPIPFDHLEMNPLTVIVIVSAWRNLHVFGSLFTSKKRNSIALDKEDPLAQSKGDESE